MNAIKKLLVAIFCLLFIILMVEISFFYTQSNKEVFNKNTEASVVIPTPTEIPRKFVFARFEQAHNFLINHAASKILLTMAFEGEITDIDPTPGTTTVPGILQFEGITNDAVGGIPHYQSKISLIGTGENNVGKKFTYFNKKEVTLVQYKDISTGKETVLNFDTLKIGDLIRIQTDLDFTASTSRGETEQKILFIRLKRANEK